MMFTGFSWIVVLAGLVLAVIWLIGQSGILSGRREGRPSGTALEILQERYATGEIGQEEYSRLRGQIG